jgi:hypothetical protein
MAADRERLEELILDGEHRRDERGRIPLRKTRLLRCRAELRRGRKRLHKCEH